MPDGWAWCRLGIVTSIFGRIGFRGYTKDDLVDSNNGAITLSPSNIISNKMNYDKCSFISWYKYEESPEIKIHNGDILLVKTGSSYGKSALVENLPKEATINPQFVVLKNTYISSEFLCYILQSSYAREIFDEFVVGTAIPTFTQANLSSMCIPIPTINQQKKITDAIKEIFDNISSLITFTTNLKNDIAICKSKILDLAIHGKLVPQDPNDEPASALLERIKAEKEELIKQGKIKRDKKESVIFKGEDNSYYEKIGSEIINISDEIPFDIPDSWSWCRGYSCFAGMNSTKPTGDSFRYIDIDSIDNKIQKIRNAKTVPTKKAPSRASRDVENGSVLFSFVRPYLKNIAYVSKEYSDCIASTGFYICNSNGALDGEFMYYLMISDYVVKGLNQFMKGDNSPSITKDNIEGWLYPIPPLMEQKEICEKISALYTEVREIEKSLN